MYGIVPVVMDPILAYRQLTKRSLVKNDDAIVFWVKKWLLAT
jgi:hypothetical protein